MLDDDGNPRFYYQIPFRGEQDKNDKMSCRSWNPEVSQ